MYSIYLHMSGIHSPPNHDLNLSLFKGLQYRRRLIKARLYFISASHGCDETNAF